MADWSILSDLRFPGKTLSLPGLTFVEEDVVEERMELLEAFMSSALMVLSRHGPIKHQ